MESVAMAQYIEGQVVDILSRRIFGARVVVQNGRIAAIEELPSAPAVFIMPGFIDAHVHVESSMLSPARFAAMAVRHGTVATVSDPHEIANVLGMEGIRHMCRNAKDLPFCLWLGAPSCVPATAFETSGAVITADDIETLFTEGTCHYLAEVMNWPGVLANDPDMVAKLDVARRLGKPIDGHAPGLLGNVAALYAAQGITTDHECYMLEEAEGKLALGMHILIREGSAARNFDALHPLLANHAERLMFCTHDAHPDLLQQGHINDLVARAVALGYDLFDVLQVACLNPIKHYGLPLGTLQVGDHADFIVVENLKHFQVQETWYHGQCVFSDGQVHFEGQPMPNKNIMKASLVDPASLIVSESSFREGDAGQVRVIQAHEGQLITTEVTAILPVHRNHLQADARQDVLKLVVLNRYTPGAKPAVAFIRGFGLQTGAIACTVAHDSHNIIAVGVEDASIAAAMNALIACGGGLALAPPHAQVEVLPLPIAGLMSDQPGEHIARDYERLNWRLADMGCPFTAPYMTLSFMALLVIPDLKLSDRGLFSSRRWNFTGLQNERPEPQPQPYQEPLVSRTATEAAAD